MICKRRLAGVVNPLLPLLVFSAMACAQQSSMQPKTEDRPLQDRVVSMERAERDAWQKPTDLAKRHRVRLIASIEHDLK